MNENPILVLNTATIKTTPHTITLNFKGGLVRHDKMEGRDFLVVPMVMALEGVLNGSQGAMYYPADELKNSCPIWNHKPVVVYHPTDKDGGGITACDPEVLTNRKIGVILNTRFEENKLKADAWLEPDRIKLVDNRIMEALDKGEMIELSTGLEVQIEKTSGEFNNVPYEGIVRNFKPDHLAVLPDQEGACSVKDGAGLLRNQGEGKINMSRDDIEDIVSMSVTNLLYKEKQMNKEKIVTALIVNEKTLWDESDKEALLAMPEAQLKKLEVVNEEPPKESEGVLEKVSDKKEDKKDDVIVPIVKNDKNEKTDTEKLAEYVKNAPGNYGEVILSGLRIHQNQKKELVAVIRANEANIFTEEVLLNKSLEELQGIAALAHIPTTNSEGSPFAGAGEVASLIGNTSKEKALVMPDVG